jgi:hypothetical protein
MQDRGSKPGMHRVEKVWAIKASLMEQVYVDDPWQRRVHHRQMIAL